MIAALLWPDEPPRPRWRTALIVAIAAVSLIALAVLLLPSSSAPPARTSASAASRGAMTGIAGKVTDEAGKPVMLYSLGVASFTPAGSSAAAPGMLMQDVSDAEGAFELTGLAPGRYELVVSPIGKALTRTAPIEVGAGAMTRGVRVVLRAGVKVTGRVTDAVTHAPLDGATVYVQLGKVTSLSKRTRDGEFALDDAPAARFDLVINHLGHMPKVVRDLDGQLGRSPVRVDVALDPFGAPATK